MTRTVVVGIDASKNSEDALVWAAEAAVAHGADLQVVHALDHSVWGLDLQMDQLMEREARALLTSRTQLVEHLLPALAVHPHLVVDSPAQALIDASRRAVLLVVGSGPTGRLGRSLIGSRSYQIASAAHCPVAVVPAIPPVGAHDVVVGVDGSPSSVEAVALAAAEADRVGDGLRVVHAWTDPAFLSDSYMVSGFSVQVRESERVVLAEAVAGISGRYPDLRVDQVLVEGAPVEVILAEAEHARLIVVGSRGRRGLSRILLGSVSHGVLLAARCPVIVARSAVGPTDERTTGGGRP
jgi:nucleotide-binding universal stress UspA family protein